MLTTDDTNRRDAIHTVGSVLSLLGDLMAARPPGGEISLSNRSADGLGDILSLAGDTMAEASFGLRDAATEVEALRARAGVGDSEYRRGYGEGLAVGSETAPVDTSPSGRATIEWWARMGYFAGYRKAMGQGAEIAADTMTDLDFLARAAVAGAYAYREAHLPIIEDMEVAANDGEGHAAPAVPSLTEPVPEAEAGSGGRQPDHDEQRHSA